MPIRVVCAGSPLLCEKHLSNSQAKCFSTQCNVANSLAPVRAKKTSDRKPMKQSRIPFALLFFAQAHTTGLWMVTFSDVLEGAARARANDSLRILVQCDCGIHFAAHRRIARRSAHFTGTLVALGRARNCPLSRALVHGDRTQLGRNVAYLAFFFQIQFLFSMPTWGLATSIVLRVLENPTSEFETDPRLGDVRLDRGRVREQLRCPGRTSRHARGWQQRASGCWWPHSFCLLPGSSDAGRRDDAPIVARTSWSGSVVVAAASRSQRGVCHRGAGQHSAGGILFVHFDATPPARGRTGRGSRCRWGR